MKRLVIAVVAVLALAATVFLVFRPRGTGVPRPSDGSGIVAAGDAGRSASAGGKSSGVAPRASARPPKPVLGLRRPAASAVGASDEADDEDDEDEEERTPEEEALAERIEKALDEEVLEDAIACAEEAQTCRLAEIRQAMVDTLGWFGAKALPELTPFLADADEDVRESAMNEWSMALSDIDDEPQKIATVELAMSVLKDEDALEDISGEYIGVDEKLAVESLMRVIAAARTSEGVAKAKETYEFVTGDEWAGADEARRWIAEEYEPPEEPAVGE